MALSGNRSASHPERHVPVMLEACMDALAIRAGGVWIDGTLGEGGHSQVMLDRSVPDGRVISIDRDTEAIASAERRIEASERWAVVHGRFGDLAQIAEQQGVFGNVDGVLVDLGISTLQLRRSERGFSFQAEGPLDMRMNATEGPTAADLIATLEEEELADIIFRYGEERASRRIARQLVTRRKENPVRTTSDLRAAVVAAGVRGRPGHDPSTRTFQAFRIAVNEEMTEVERLLDDGYEVLAPGGRLAVLSYHSLEDRLVKNAFRRWASDCLCPPRSPVCDCGWSAKVRLVSRRKIKPSEEEVQANPRARSAGLRVVERLSEAPKNPVPGAG